jgi:hypothetical protein
MSDDSRPVRNAPSITWHDRSDAARTPDFSRLRTFQLPRPMGPADPSVSSRPVPSTPSPSIWRRVLHLLNAEDRQTAETFLRTNSGGRR